MPLDMAAAAFGSWVPSLVADSLRRSGETQQPSEAVIAAHRGFLAANEPRVANLEILAAYLAPGATLREAPDAADQHGVVPSLPDALADLLALTRSGLASADEAVQLFRLLRPFTMGNGRVARALWLWRTIREPGMSAEALAALSFPQAPASADGHGAPALTAYVGRPQGQCV
ncbi:hypothetical protein [Aurantimonas coralicida]|uniref:hypothetical protein n=1 Tax=Aurantimonas coralicida TaxID=182270 RepID=UPI001E5648A3|nr:hypothetical protein [Aurantimonas coralicida]MCD1641624.1 hypothetical protein [Aurantimonas coralicida]